MWSWAEGCEVGGWRKPHQQSQGAKFHRHRAGEFKGHTCRLHKGGLFSPLACLHSCWRHFLKQTFISRTSFVQSSTHGPGFHSPPLILAKFWPGVRAVSRYTCCGSWSTGVWMAKAMPPPSYEILQQKWEIWRVLPSGNKTCDLPLAPALSNVSSVL